MTPDEVIIVRRFFVVVSLIFAELGLVPEETSVNINAKSKAGERLLVTVNLAESMVEVDALLPPVQPQ